MPGYDLHTHLAPALPELPPGIERAPDGALAVDGRPVGPVDLYHAERLEEHLDKAGLDGAVVSLPPPFFRQTLPIEWTPAWVRVVNEGLLAAVAGAPRLAPLAYLPLEHPEAALAEYRRIGRDLRFVGVAAAAGGLSVSLADTRLDPLWAALEVDRRPLMLHPGASPDIRLREFYLGNLLGNPSETGLAAAQLVFGGVLSRHPALKVLLVHCGGVAPAVAGRWQRGADTARPGIPSETEPPAHALRRLFVDCLAHDPAVVDLAVTVFGADRMVLGSDWPFPMGTADPVGLVAHRGTAFTRRVGVSNAEAWLGW
ncbi:aminocarboxymuconate-semialdehyde decarboxylase [Actinomadura coerulea]|uniref:Aminocarboxymuconate-semialdehyde decarboxylase n=1 Tax=Actinomadura coerulea TaxID=46159 RepID=A0A7X0KZ20_9ACTN|nr:amidohydrolase family protein [Actinomadura coerulea]MBB6395704.1 aminocarboxymuconate-semialdehyde decarboxylase [Actinomadura coerulea]GGQ26533.1 amidohydrolase [Actinomadura coerulea]